jgi:hypothetical protein
MGSLRIIQGKNWAEIRRERKRAMREKSCRAASFIAPLIRNRVTVTKMRISKGPIVLHKTESSPKAGR